MKLTADREWESKCEGSLLVIVSEIIAHDLLKGEEKKEEGN